MSHAQTEVHQDDPIHQTLGETPSPAAVFDVFSAGKQSVVVLHRVASVRLRFLDRLTADFRVRGARVIRAASPEGRPLDLQALMEQIVGPAEQQGAERIECFYSALTTPEENETRIVLIIDDAHLLAQETLIYLDLLVSSPDIPKVPVQFLLAGSPELWDRLPVTGGFAAITIGAPILLPSEGAEPLANRARQAENEPALRAAGQRYDGGSPAGVENPLATPAVNRSSRLRSVALVALAGLLVCGVGGGTLWLQLRHYERAGLRHADISSYLWWQASRARTAPAVDAVSADAPTLPAGPAVLALPAATHEATAAQPASSPTLAMVQPKAVEPFDAKPSHSAQAPDAGTAPAGPPAPAATPASSPAPRPTAPAPQPIGQSPDPRAADLFKRGQEAEQHGDISGARRFYASAAERGHAGAARSLGRLYDPAVAGQTFLGGIDSDPASARYWYERAAAMGDAEAARLLHVVTTR